MVALGVQIDCRFFVRLAQFLGLTSSEAVLMVPFFSACGHFGPTFLLLLALLLGLTCFEAALIVLFLLSCWSSCYFEIALVYCSPCAAPWAYGL